VLPSAWLIAVQVGGSARVLPDLLHHSAPLSPWPARRDSSWGRAGRGACRCCGRTARPRRQDLGGPGAHPVRH